MPRHRIVAPPALRSVETAYLFGDATIIASALGVAAGWRRFPAEEIKYPLKHSSVVSEKNGKMEKICTPFLSSSSSSTSSTFHGPVYLLFHFFKS